MGSSSSSTVGTVNHQPPPEQIRAHLERILASAAFRSSKRCHRFLQFVTLQTLQGNADTLKERTLAVEVFDRAPSWDPADDTIVRVGAREVRKRLAQFYMSPEGMHENLRINLLSGSYVPEFCFASAEIMDPVTETLPKVASETGFRKWAVRLIGAIAAITAIVVGLNYVSSQSPFDEFWKPVWESEGPLLVAMAHPILYQPSSRALELDLKLHGPTQNFTQRIVQLPPGALTQSEVIPIENQFVGFGDAVVASGIATLLAPRSKEARLRFANKLDFADLRETPTLFVGAFTNQWTMQFSRNFRFQFQLDSKGKATIEDTQTKKVWGLPDRQENNTVSEDYFLIARLANSPSGKLMIIAGGIMQVGTQAAGRLLVSPPQLAQTLSRLGAGWENRNFEMVLHTKVIGNTPSPPEPVAWRVW